LDLAAWSTVLALAWCQARESAGRDAKIRRRQGRRFMISPAEPGGGRPDSSNQFQVIKTKSGLFAMRVPPFQRQLVITRDEALNLAGWLVALADPDHMDFLVVLEAIEKT
jgi:hypothetical protein